MNKFILMILILTAMTLVACELEEEPKKVAETKEETKEVKEIDHAVAEWGSYRDKLMNEYSEFYVTDIQTDDNYIIFRVTVPNKFKLSHENELEYYMSEVGTDIFNKISRYFNKSIKVYFHYQDGSIMGSSKLTGGWKLH